MMPAIHPGPVGIEPAPQTRRSVFGNYASAGETPGAPVGPPPPASPPPPRALEGCVDLAWSRSFVLQFLARAYEYPTAETWAWLSAGDVQAGLRAALTALEPDPQAHPTEAGHAVALAFRPDTFSAFHDDYITAIGHAARGPCPANEIEYGDLKADPLFQPHRLADLAAFYRAFGLELGAFADERHDHLAVELEFMAVLAAQEASLLNQAPESEPLSVCRDAQRKFLREHLGRWTPAFARRLQRAVGDGPLGTLAALTLTVIEGECRRLNLTPGSEDLLLRPADEGASLCDGCGIQDPPPGAVPPA